MNKYLLYPVLLMIMAFTFISCGDNSNSEQDQDCQQAQQIWGSNKDKNLGQQCYSGSYGTCPNNYDDCAEGSCMSTGSGMYCSISCTSNADCSSFGYYCKNQVCTPPASCTTYCDGTSCCDYYQDPNDPTQCKQGTCYLTAPTVQEGVTPLLNP